MFRRKKLEEGNHMGTVPGTSNQGKAPLFSAKELTLSYYQIESQTSIISIAESAAPLVPGFQ